MSDEQSTDNVNENGQDGAQGAPQATDATQGGQEPKVFSEDYVKSLRNESAEWRTKFRDLEGKLQNAKTVEEFNAATQEFSEQLRQKDIELVALKHNIPDALRTRLQGATLAELEADAQAIAALLGDTGKQNPPPRAANPSGGMDPTTDDDGETDPDKLAARANRRRRGF